MSFRLPFRLQSLPRPFRSLQLSLRSLLHCPPLLSRRLQRAPWVLRPVFAAPLRFLFRPLVFLRALLPLLRRLRRLLLSFLPFPHAHPRSGLGRALHLCPLRAPRPPLLFPCPLRAALVPFGRVMSLPLLRLLLTPPSLLRLALFFSSTLRSLTSLPSASAAGR
jgi:hypothetical protein